MEDLNKAVQPSLLRYIIRGSTAQFSSLQHFQVLVVVFGQELPDSAASATSQLFSLIVAAVGFASFALVLALVEQVVLQVGYFQPTSRKNVHSLSHSTPPTIHTNWQRW